MTLKEKVLQFVAEASGFAGAEINYPEVEGFGDFSTNVALRLAKERKENPLKLAGEFAAEIKAADRGGFFKEVKAAPPGFVNFWLSDRTLADELARALKEKKNYGRPAVSAKPQKINIEFVSANPTGPLTMANGRGGFLGAALANILEFSGYAVTREYYVNDAGNQIKNLGGSILAELGVIPPADNHYKGGYINGLAKKFGKKKDLFNFKIEGEISALQNGTKPLVDAELSALQMKLGQLAAGQLLKEIKTSLKKAGVTFDVWTSESADLREKELPEKALEELRGRGLVTSHDGALWLAKEIAGEKERVLRKSDGEFTYYLVDLSYHLAKLARSDKAIDLWGADHHGNVAPMKEGLRLLGADPERLSVIMFQPVRLVRDGEEVKMSKRAGEFITLDELIEETGVDAAKFFFLMITPGSRIDFDLALAKERSMKNPVYYAQYAYVRAEAILKKAGKLKKGKAETLTTAEDRALIVELSKFPDMVRQTAADYEVSRLARYSVELARSFHNFYEKERVVGEAADVAAARAMLVASAAGVLKNVFTLLGIRNPEKM